MVESGDRSKHISKFILETKKKIDLGNFGITFVYFHCWGWQEGIFWAAGDNDAPSNTLQCKSNLSARCRCKQLKIKHFHLEYTNVFILLPLTL